MRTTAAQSNCTHVGTKFSLLHPLPKVNLTPIIRKGAGGEGESQFWFWGVFFGKKKKKVPQ